MVARVMTGNPRRSVIGIVGGLGPVASAEFLKTIYERSIGEREQQSPTVLMYSDPSFPDRTETFAVGSSEAMLEKLVEALRCLCDMGASKIIICCVTMHYLLPRLPGYLRERIISLIDVILENLLRARRKHLLICSNGTRKIEIFQSHDLWDRSKDYLVLPDESDQRMIHDVIYKIKRNYDASQLTQSLELLLSKYEVDAFIAGCTEIHLLSKCIAKSASGRKSHSFLDPLWIIAKEIARERL